MSSSEDEAPARLPDSASSATSISVLIRLALPLMLANLAQTMLSWVDTAMVGRLGPTSLAAMGPATVFFLVLFLMVSAGFMGIQTLCSRRFGEKKMEAAGQVLTVGLRISLFTGVVAGTIGLLFSDDLARLIVEDPATAALSGDYLFWRWGGVLSLTLLWAYKGFFFGIGVTWFDMVLAFAMNLLNILFNWMFIFGNLGAPEMGLSGAAIASVLATAFATLSYAGLSLKKKYRVPFQLYHGGWDGHVAKRIIKLSFPRALAGLAFGGSVIYFKWIGDYAGTTALAASTVIWRFFGTTVLISLALGTAAATLVGQRLGARDLDGAERAAKQAVKLGVALTSVVSLAIILFPHAILRIFTEDETVISTGAPALQVLAIFISIDSAGIILSRVLSAAGCVLYVMTMEFCVWIFLMLPSAWILIRSYPDNLTIIWCAWGVYILGWYGSMAYKFGKGDWRRVVV